MQFFSFLKFDKCRSIKIERKILKGFNHQHKVRMMSTFEDDDYMYFVLEYAPNGDLKKLINILRKQ
jgi:serine/threonine protein kinase